MVAARPKKIQHSRLLEIMRYDPETGIFISVGRRDFARVA